VNRNAAHGARRAGGPYKGLDRYDEDDWWLFFGRTHERDLIVTNLRARRVTLLYGRSGVGKSSLLRAGVGHHLRDLARHNVHEIGVPEYVPVIVSNWRDDPVATVRGALFDAVDEFVETGRRSSGSLAETIERLSSAVESRVLVVLDQLEEYFLYHGHPTGDDPLRPELAEALTRPHLHVSFLLSIREDSLARLDPLRRRVPALFTSVLHLEALDRGNARAAIVEPLARYREPGPREVEETLVDELLDQLAGGAPVPEQAGQGRIGKRSDRIDPSYLQVVLSSLWEREEDEDRLRLTTLEQLGGTESIARRHLDEALDGLPAREREVAADALRFLVTPLGAKIALAAEELASFTGEDVEPVLEQLAGRARVLRAVSASGHDEPTRYEIFHDVLGPAVLDWRARFVRERDRAKLELETDEARRRAKEERRRARLFGALAISAFAALICALVASGYAWHEKSSADRQRRHAESRALAAEVPALLSSRLGDGVLRAVESRSSADTFEARRALLLAVRRTEGLVRFVRFGRRVTTAGAGPGDTYVAALETGDLVVLDRSGRRIGRWSGEGSAVTALAFNPRLRLVAVGGQQSVKILGGRSGALGTRWRGRVLDPQMTVTALAFESKGRRFAAGGQGGITLWRLDAQGEPLAPPRRLSVNDVSALSFDHGGWGLVARTSKGALRWDLRHPDRPATPVRESALPRLAGHVGTPTAVSVERPRDLLAAGDASGRVALWRADDGGWRFARTFDGQGDTIVAVVFDATGKRFAAASRDGTVAVWDVGAGNPVIRGAGVAPVADRRLAVVTRSGSLEVRGIDGAVRRRVAANGIALVSGSPDGRAFVAAGPDGLLASNDAWRSTHRFARGLQLRDVAVADDGTSVGVRGSDVAVGRWDSSGRFIGALQPPTSLGRSATALTAAIDADGSRVAAGYYAGQVVLWSGSRASVLRRRGPPVTAVAFGRDGSSLAVGDDGGGVELRRVSSGDVTRIVAHPTTVLRLAFSPDGRILASGGDDGAVRLWDVESGGLLGDLVSGGPPVTALTFSPDGRSLVAAHGVITVWDTTEWRVGPKAFGQVVVHLCSLVGISRHAGSPCT
jgi:WD40 repeat protein